LPHLTVGGGSGCSCFGGGARCSDIAPWDEWGSAARSNQVCFNYLILVTLLPRAKGTHYRSPGLVCRVCMWC